MRKLSELNFGVVSKLPDGSRYSVALIPQKWDDFGFKTLYNSEFYDKQGRRWKIGSVKIGEYGLQPSLKTNKFAPGLGSPTIPTRFRSLDRDLHFSVGQDASYYEILNEIDKDNTGFRDDYLLAMNDMAFRKNTRTRAMAEPVTETSLLRTLSWKAVRDQFARLARGGQAVRSYKFVFPIRDEIGAPELECNVRPNALPPENLRVLIGRNGSGKTTTLRDIAKILIDGSELEDVESAISGQRDQLANLVSVSFSAFDPFEPIATRRSSHGLNYRYIGLKTYDLPLSKDSRSKTLTLQDGQAPSVNMPLNAVVRPESDGHTPTDADFARWRPMTVPELDRSAADAVHICTGVAAQRQLLVDALNLLEKDPNFASFAIRDLVVRAGPNSKIKARILPLIQKMSAGHKIALLAISHLVVSVQEKTMVLIDEPEAHLHPPLLSAFMRALSNLLKERNGLAIVATHSPVVLQEVPRSCVRIIDNQTPRIVLRQPQIETFGENVGALTGEVFGLELSSTGYHAILREVADGAESYEVALSQLGGQVGAEGRAILRAMMAARRDRNFS